MDQPLLVPLSDTEIADALGVGVAERVEVIDWQRPVWARTCGGPTPPVVTIATPTDDGPCYPPCLVSES